MYVEVAARREKLACCRIGKDGIMAPIARFGALTGLALIAFAAAASCEADDTNGTGGGASTTSTTTTTTTTTSITTSTVDCGCSCAETPDQMSLCACPGQLDIDCCPDDAVPVCAGGVDPVCVPNPAFGWFCPCENEALPDCPASAPPSCAAGAAELDPSDDVWTCAGCDPALPPPCSSGGCPTCTGATWGCSDPCPGTGGGGGAGGAGGAGGG